MSRELRQGRGFDLFCLALALALLAALIALSAWLWQGRQQPLLLAPAIGELSDCLEMAAPSRAVASASASLTSTVPSRITRKPRRAGWPAG